MKRVLVDYGVVSRTSHELQCKLIETDRQITIDHHLDRPNDLIHHLHIYQADPKLLAWSSGRCIVYTV